MAWYPGAIRKEIRKFNAPMLAHRAFILHVAVSEAASLYGYFSGAAVCSHFYVRKDGTVEQYVDTRFRAPANLEGNTTCVSVETQGGVHDAQGEPWTVQQRASLAALTRWVAETHGIPLVNMPNSRRGSTGVGYHRQGIDPWRVLLGEKWSNSRGKICPGNAKIESIPGIVLAAGGAVIPVNDNPEPGNGGGSKSYLSRGDSGPAVSNLQTLLNAAGGYGLVVDGQFGPATEAAVRSFQALKGLIIDGLAGPATMAALTPQPAPTPPPAPTGGVLKRGDQGDAVKTLQAHLKRVYPTYASKLVVDGIFGPATEAVVREFQHRAGITVDGIVGPQTLAALGLNVDTSPTPPAPPAPAPIPVNPPSAPVLQVGSRGPAVVELQATLNRKYPAYSKLTTDGIFGNATRNVVIEFQKRSGLVADGIVGPRTRAALGL